MHASIRSAVSLTILFAALTIPPALAAAPEDYEEILTVDLYGQVFASTSELEAPAFGELGSYGAHTLFDGSRYTGWSEGVPGHGVGEALWIRIPHGTDTLLIINGFARSESLFRRNNRVQTAEVTLHHGFLPEGMVTEVGPVYVVEPLDRSLILRFQDHSELQEIRLPLGWEDVPVIQSYWRQLYDRLAAVRGLPPRMQDHAFFLRLEIREIYRGSEWDDTCLTELRAFNRDRASVTQIYEANGVLYYDTPDSQGRILAQSTRRLYQLIDGDDANRWALVAAVPKQAEGRVSTEYLLFQAPYPDPRRVPEVEEQLAAGAAPLGFSPGRSLTLLRFDNGITVELPAR